MENTNTNTNINTSNNKIVNDANTITKSEKVNLVAFLLCFFLGGLGIHRFYVGKIGTGVAQIFTLGGLGIWWLIDLIMIAISKFKDKSGNTLTW